MGKSGVRDRGKDWEKGRLEIGGRMEIWEGG